MKKISSLHIPLVLIALFFPASLFAADAIMEVSPSIGTYKVYDDVTIRILVSSGADRASGVDGRLSFNPKELTVTHVIKNDSPITSWTTEPAVDGELGEIIFGGTLATSTKLSATAILTLRVRPERVGETLLRFEGGAAIILADGLGTNVLTGFKSGKYRVLPEEFSDTAVTPVVSPTSGENASAGGEVLGATASSVRFVTSVSHPNEDGWKNASSSLFAFVLPVDTASLRLGFDKKENGRGEKNYSPPLTEKKIDDLEEGIWYLHASLETKSGTMLAQDYRIQTDYTPPTNFSVTEIAGRDNADPDIIIAVAATDALSGIEYYAFAVDGRVAERFVDTGTHQYTYRALSTGMHTMVASVYDFAGNYVSKEIKFTVGEVPAPRLSLRDDGFEEGDELRVLVEAAPRTDVNVAVAHDDEPAISVRVKTNDDGVVTFTKKEELKKGTYTITGVVYASHGGISPESEVLHVIVEPTFFGMFERHPFIPFAILLFLLTMLFALRVFRRLSETHVDDMPLDDVEAYTDLSEPRATTEVYADTFLQNGQVILSPRIKNSPQ